MKKRTRVTLLIIVILACWGSHLQSMLSTRMFSTFFVSNSCVASARTTFWKFPGRAEFWRQFQQQYTDRVSSVQHDVHRHGRTYSWWTMNVQISIQTTHIPSRHQQRFSINVWMAIKGDTPVCPSCFPKQADMCSLSCHFLQHPSTVTTECPSIDLGARFILNASVSMSGYCWQTLGQFVLHRPFLRFTTKFYSSRYIQYHIYLSLLDNNGGLYVVPSHGPWRLYIGESRLLWGDFLIWGCPLFHTRRCCALHLRM